MTKMKSCITTIAISIAIFLAGCTAPTLIPPDEPTHDTSQNFSADYDSVWEATVDWFSDRNIPIKQIEKDSGLIASDYSLRTGQDILDCGYLEGGSGMTLVSEDHTANLNVRVRAVNAEESTVSLNVFGESNYLYQNPMDRSVTETVTSDNCVSTGALEGELFDFISASIR